PGSGAPSDDIALLVLRRLPDGSAPMSRRTSGTVGNCPSREARRSSGPTAARLWIISGLSRKASAENPALDLAPVIHQRVIQVQAARLRSGVGLAVADRPEDGVVLLHRSVGVSAEAELAQQADLALQHARFPDGGDEERVV